MCGGLSNAFQVGGGVYLGALARNNLYAVMWVGMLVSVSREYHEIRGV